MTESKHTPGLASETVAVQALDKAQDETGALVPPVQVSKTFERDPDGGGRGDTRPNNPTYDVPESLRATPPGGVESLIEHRASVEGRSTPAPANLLRRAIGLENADDLIADLEQAMGAA